MSHGLKDAERGRLLLRIARESLAEALGLAASIAAEAYDEPWLREPGRAS